MTFRCQSPSVHFQLEGKSVLQRGWLLVPSFLYKTLLALLKEMKGVLYSVFSSVVSDFLGKYNLRWTFALFQNRFFVFLLFIVQVLTGDLSTIRTWPINATRYFRHLLTKWFFWCCPVLGHISNVVMLFFRLHKTYTCFIEPSHQLSMYIEWKKYSLLDD